MVRKQRILLWTAFYPPHVGGMENNTAELVKRLRSRGYRVQVVTCDSTPEPSDAIRLPSWPLSNGACPLPKPTLGLLRVMAMRGFDIVSTQTRFFPTSFLGAIYALLHRVPLIHTERGTGHMVIASPIVSLISRFHDHTIGAWILRRARVVIGVSDAVCKFTRHLGVRVSIRIPNGVSVSPGYIRAPCLRHTILFVGRLIKGKGVQDLLAAVKRIPWNCKVIVVGDGPYRAELERLAAGSDVEFRGILTGKEIEVAYTSASICVNPSYSEGLPTSVMEAAAYGVPVVATDVGGTNEIIRHLSTGILVKPGDVESLAKAIHRLLDNPHWTAQMANRAKEFVVREYSWDTITDQYCQILESV